MKEYNTKVNNNDDVYIKLSDIEKIVRYEYIGIDDTPKPVILFNQLNNNLKKYIYNTTTSEFEVLNNHTYKGVKE